MLVVWAGPASASPSTGHAVAVTTSSNWSGYVATGRSYNEASGTFTVPNVSRYLARSTASEWVGVDGWSDSSLVQAGVNEVPVGHGATIFEPWWEVVPGPQQFASGVMVRAGNRITVKVQEISAGRWSISLIDNTNGDHFSTVQPYSGEATSAEWVVEADATARGSSTELAPLAGKVTFTGATLDNAPASPGEALQSGTELGALTSSTAAGLAATTFTKVVMVQGGQAVSTPSTFDAGAFSVKYS